MNTIAKPHAKDCVSREQHSDFIATDKQSFKMSTARLRRAGTAYNFVQFCRAVRAADARQLGTKCCSLKIVTTNVVIK